MRISTPTVCLVAALCACSERVADVAQPIINGSPDAADTAVVGLTRRPTTCDPLPYAIDCTATLIAPRVVLTAAHCLGGNPANALAVFFGEDVAAGGSVVTVRSGTSHPDFDATTHANDVAALILDDDAPVGVVPIALRMTPLPDLSGTDVRIVGYGLASTTDVVTGVRRSGTAMVTAVGAAEITMAPGPAMSCQGDSGGPVLAPAPGGGEELIGVTSWGDPGCVERGVAIRVDPLADFLQPVLDEAATPTSREPFDPDAALCETRCTADSDCPAETVCFAPPGAPKRCTYHGFTQAELGAPCTMASSDHLCVPVGDSCRELITCDEGGNEPGCSCGVQHGAGRGGTFTLLVLAVAVALRRPTRRFARRRPAARST